MKRSLLTEDEIKFCEGTDMALQLHSLTSVLRMALLCNDIAVVPAVRRLHESDITMGLLEADLDDMLDRSLPLNDLTTRYLWFIADKLYHARKDERTVLRKA